MVDKHNPFDWMQQLAHNNTSQEWREFIREEQQHDRVGALLIGPGARWNKTHDGYLLVIPEGTTDVKPAELEALLNEWGVAHPKMGELIDKDNADRRDLGITVTHEDYHIVEAQRDYLRQLPGRR